MRAAVVGLLLLCFALRTAAIACCVLPPETHNHEQHKTHTTVSIAVSLAAVMPAPTAQGPADAWPPILLILTCTTITVGIIIFRSRGPLLRSHPDTRARTPLSANDNRGKRRIA